MHKIWTLEGVANTFAQYKQQHGYQSRLLVPESDNKYAAVLLPLIMVDQQLSLLFIERAKNPHDMHSGQVAFPGGKVEHDDEHFVATALRETHEEIGLSVDIGRVISMLPMQQSRHHYQVRPVIACVSWPQDLVLQTTEVASVFTIPLSWLSDQANLDSATVLGLPEGFTTVYKPYKGHRVWGLTANIIQELIKILLT